MAVQWGTTLRNALLDQIETTIGTAARIRIYTGSPPADCATAASGTLLVTFVLASDWASAASAGSKSLSGLPITQAAVAAGTAGYYRIWDSGVSVTHEQGTVTATGGGGDVTVDNTSIANGQNVSITAWTKTAPGA